jgi:hypothetical protein
MQILPEDEGCEFSDEINKTEAFCGLTSESIRTIEIQCESGSNLLLKHMDLYELNPEAKVSFFAKLFDTLFVNCHFLNYR